MKLVHMVVVAVVALVGVQVYAQDAKTYVGVITDTMCTNDHTSIADVTSRVGAVVLGIGIGSVRHSSMHRPHFFAASFSLKRAPRRTSSMP